MIKAFVLDTNVILFDPRGILMFGENEVHLPMTVIEETEKFKKDMSETGRNAREFSRMLDQHRKEGDLPKGLKLNNGGTLFVHVDAHTNLLPADLNHGLADNRILGTALNLQKNRPKDSVVLVSKDVNLRIKANILGIEAEDFEPEKTQSKEEGAYNGFITLDVNPKFIDLFYTTKKLLISELETGKIYPNQFVILRDNTNPHHTAIARYDLDADALLPLRRPTEGLWGIYPKNMEQSFALDALLDDDIKLVTLAGKAGTGKTLLAIAAGLSKSVDDGVYSRLLVSRPVFPLGKDIGFLPGDINEKLNPWMQPIYDNVEFLFGISGGGRVTKRGIGRGVQELMNQGLLTIEPLTYIRGRSIPGQYFIVDESQNLTPHEIKTIITRAGDDTKIILTGDVNQIDNPYVDSLNNGLSYVVERFKNEPIAAHVHFTKGERSILSELASNLL